MKKLVRDKIPELMLEVGQTVTVTKAFGEEQQCKLLEEKFEEEVEEFRNDPCVEELADIIEVALEMLDTDIQYVYDVLLKKRAQKGGFKKYYVVEL